MIEHKKIYFFYTKQAYRKIVKRLTEDESSIWYDHLEQMKKDYADMKEIYKKINTVKPRQQGEDTKED
jgi:hypothetical protein